MRCTAEEAALTYPQRLAQLLAVLRRPAWWAGAVEVRLKAMHKHAHTVAWQQQVVSSTSAAAAAHEQRISSGAAAAGVLLR